MEKEKDFLPILVVPAVPIENGIRFLHHSKQLDVIGDMSTNIWSILSHCNGYTSVESISRRTNFEPEFVASIIDDLSTMEVIVDSRKQYLHFHRISNHPAPYYRNLTREEIRCYTSSERIPAQSGETLKFHLDKKSNLYHLQTNRRSCRSFSNEKLSRDQIGNLCSFGYSIIRHTVPSGGELYPLKLFVIVAEKQKELRAGYYEFDAEHDTLILYNQRIDIEQLKYCFNEESLPFGSSVQIVIAADLHRQPYKYSNRGYRLTLIEVGQVAQNISLYCEDQNIGCCELGGILDEAMSRELSMCDGVVPLLAIAIGKKASKEPVRDSLLLEELSKCLSGKDKPIMDYGLSCKDKDVSFFGAYAHFSNSSGNTSTAGATSTSTDLALVKAIVEGYERHRSSQVRTDHAGPACEISMPWLNPMDIVPLDTQQIMHYGLTQFNNELKISWTLGTKTDDGSDILVPSDIVYYGHTVDQNRILYGNSSGIAAFTKVQEAKRRSLIELIERDALIRNWFERRTPKKIARECLPVHTQKRIDFWNSQHRNLIVLDMGSPYVPTIQVVITGENYPCFVSGAGASIDSLESAIHKATQEAEYSLVMERRKRNIKPIPPEAVRLPEHHGRLYHFPNHIDNIAWLWSGEECDSLPIATYTYNELLRLLSVIFVDISEPNSPIKVVRSFSKKLIPISFGWNADYYLHPVVKGLDYDEKCRNLPHYFA